MPTYSYSARGKDGKTVKGLRAAESIHALAQELGAQALFLVKASPVASSKEGKSGRGPKLKRKEMVAFLMHLASYVEAGVPILSALQDFREPEKPALDAAIQDVRRRLEGGSSLSEALAIYPSLFPPLQVSMIRAGESSGRLDEALKEVVKLVEWEEEFTAQVKQAATYPLIVVGILSLAVGLISVMVLPKILTLLREFNVPLPLATRIFLALGDFLAAYGWMIPLALFGTYFGLKFGLKNHAFRLWWDTRLLHLPMVGGLLTRISLSRFSSFFAAQYRAGIPVITVLKECEDLTGNARLGLCVRQIREGVEGGERLAVMAERVGYFPRLVLRMIAIGEEAGNLETTLGKVTQYFDSEVKASIKRFFQLLEPALLIVLACLLVFVALAVLLPIYTMIGGINAQAR